MVARQMTMLRRCAPLWAIMGLLAGCQQPGGGQGIGFNYEQGPDMDQSGQISPLVGTLGGAGIGALAGRLLAGSHDNTAAILGGALIGGLAGNLGTNAFNEHKEQQATTQYDQQQQLAYTQSQLAQQEAVNRQLEARASTASGASSQGLAVAGGSPAEVTTAQRMLTVLGSTTAPIDGRERTGDLDRDRANSRKSRGLPITGNVTPCADLSMTAGGDMRRLALHAGPGAAGPGAAALAQDVQPPPLADTVRDRGHPCDKVDLGRARRGGRAGPTRRSGS